MEKTKNELQKLGVEISEKIESERIYEKIQWSLSILFLVILPIWMLLLGIQLIFPINIDGNNIVIILFMLFFFTFIILLLLKKYVINGIKEICNTNDRILYIDLNTSSFEDTISGFVLNYTNSKMLLHWENIIQWILFYRENGGKELGWKISAFLQGEIQYTLQLMTNLSSDLAAYIEREQQTLESAKSVVEKNIKGTTELEQVSEVQKMRLDKQIEQFEELQRLLTKD